MGIFKKNKQTYISLERTRILILIELFPYVCEFALKIFSREIETDSMTTGKPFKRNHPHNEILNKNMTEAYLNSQKIYTL